MFITCCCDRPNKVDFTLLILIHKEIQILITSIDIYVIDMINLYACLRLGKSVVFR